jgi:tetratricopeptide (TPR) repeat protein
MGVIHRDVKPGNILLDSGGHLWVTDFGLARFHDEPGLTRTGDIVGTLRYMSPEQVLGKSAPVDQRSDVYALGVTLYELLTLEPAYSGRDRQELLRQIANSEPAAPRRLNKAIPVELETVVLKAMAREPARRYGTADELADDLRRFLEHRPIKARRPTLVERATKFARRHRTATIAAAMILVLAVMGLGATTVLIWREKERTKAALALEATQRRRTDANFQHALDGATQLLLPLEDERLKGTPAMDGLRQELVGRGVRFFEGFVHPDDPDPAVRFESARACLYLASTFSAHQKVDLAWQKMHQAEAILEALLEEYPTEAAYRKQLASTYLLSATLATSMHQPREAREDYSRVSEQYGRAVEHDDSAETSNAFAWFLADCPDAGLRDPARAIFFALQATARAPEKAAYWNTLGVAYYRAGDWRKAIAALEKSVELQGSGDPWDWYFLAMATWQAGDHRAAGAWYEKALNSMERIAPLPLELLRYRAEADVLLGKKRAEAPVVDTGTPAGKSNITDKD